MLLICSSLLFLCISITIHKGLFNHYSASIIFNSIESTENFTNDLHQSASNKELSDRIFPSIVHQKEIPVLDVIPKENTLVFGGDVMLSRYVDVLMKKYKDYQGPLRGVVDLLSAADIAFVNLESPFNPNPRYFSRGMVFGADIKAMEGLIQAGIDIVSLANNHFGDSGQKGMIFTMEKLLENNIYYTGGGIDSREANSPRFITSNGITFAFLAYCDISKYYAATKNKAGYALVPDLLFLKEQIERAKRLADVVIISIHTGAEYVRYPHQRLIDFSHQAIDYGASLIIGHHPHVIQPMEYYKDGVIFYSLGNLVFDQYFPGTKEGILAEIKFEDTEIVKTKVHPIVIEGLWKVRKAKEEEKTKIMNRVDWD